MKTLADLKRNLHNCEFKLFENSWYKQLPEFQAQWRKVGKVNSVGFTLLTDKQGNGEYSHSHIDYPKASEIQLIQLNEEKTHFTLIIKRDCYTKHQVTVEHIMIYEIKLHNNEA
jgi:hypothetical protein